MRSIVLVFAVALAACTTTQEPADTSTRATEPPPSSTTSPPSTTSTTTTPPPTTTEPTTTTTLPPLQGIEYVEIAGLAFPIQMTALPGSEHSYIAVKDGQVWLLDGAGVVQGPILDISERVLNDGERGLLSIAIHPDDPTRFFAHYTANDGDTVVSEFAFVATDEIDATSETLLLRLDQPAANHNGGMIQFGPDRSTLYVGLGDGGGSGDRFNNGQNLDTLLGGLVAIPVDGGEPELWNHGLRNPWRFWIDGDLVYVADVGQNRYEEVSVATLAPGHDFGWPITEGLHCFRPSSGCDTEGQVLPVVEVGHDDSGTCSITGGLVYRGAAIPEIAGMYFYSDFCGGYLRSFRYASGEAVDLTDWTDQVGVPGRVVSFGVDGAGEMYVLTTNRVLKVVPVRG